MFSLIFASILLSLNHVRSTNFNFETRIVGGQNTTIEEYPYQLSLEDINQNGMHVCGASLLKPNVALTAAHCTHFYKASDLRIRAGSTIREEDGEIANILNICEHPKFSEQIVDCDVAVLVFDRELPLGPNIQPIELQQKGDEISDGTIGTVTGWGALYWGGPSPDILQKVELSKINIDYCKKVYDKITDNMFCFGHLEGGKDSCSRDSGGPIAVNGKQVGVVSFGQKCGGAGIPGVYAKLSSEDISNHIDKCLADLF